MPFDAIDEIEAVIVSSAGPKLSSYHVVVFGTDGSGHYLSKAPLFRGVEAETVAKTLRGWLAKARRRN